MKDSFAESAHPENAATASLVLELQNGETSGSAPGETDLSKPPKCVERRSSRKLETASQKGSEGSKTPKRADSELQKFKLTADINTLFEVEKQQEKLSVMKAHLPLGRLFFLGCLAGWWVALAAILVVSIVGGIPADVRKSWPMLPKLITGFLFPVSICYINMFGGELFTGNAMAMLIGLWAKRITVLELIYNWIVVLVSNFTGCVTTVYFFGYHTQLFNTEPWTSYITGVAVSKINLPPHVAFLRAITANALVCTCILLGLSARDMLGKLVAMWFPIMTFAATGFEHAIANMAFIPLGLMYGADHDVDYRVWLYQNLLLVILGNIVGGGFIVGGAGYFLYDWTKVLSKQESQQVALTHVPVVRPQDERPPAPMALCAIPEAQAQNQIASQEGQGEDERAEEVFRLFDSDGDGRIVGIEVMCALNALGLSYPKPLIEAMVWAQKPAGERGNCVSAGVNEFVGVVHRIQDMEMLGLKDFIMRQ